MILTAFISNLTAEPGLASTVISFSRFEFNNIRRAKAREGRKARSSGQSCSAIDQCRLDRNRGGQYGERDVGERALKRRIGGRVGQPREVAGASAVRHG
jgi:hypothetical protein